MHYFVAFFATLWATAAAEEIALALGGIDVVSCKSSKTDCKDVGDAKWSTEYTSVDAEGNGVYTSEFRFVSEDNMIAFENGPITFLPRSKCHCIG